MLSPEDVRKTMATASRGIRPVALFDTARAPRGKTGFVSHRNSTSGRYGSTDRQGCGEAHHALDRRIPSYRFNKYGLAGAENYLG